MPSPLDPLMKDALLAVKTRMINQSSTATPEELAYLGAAYEKIAGPATVYEVIDWGEYKKQELTEHQSNLSDLLNTQWTDHSDALNIQWTDHTDALNTTMTTAQTNVTNTKDAAEASIESTKQAATTFITNSRNAAETYITDIKEAAMAAISIALAANLVTQQFTFGVDAHFYSNNR